MHAQSAAARWRQQGVSQVSPTQLRSISNSKRSSSRMKKKKKAERERGRELWRAQSKQLLEQHLDGTRMEWQPDLCSPVAQAWADMRNTLESNERKQHQQNYYNLCIPFLFLFSVFCLFFSAVCVCECALAGPFNLWHALGSPVYPCYARAKHSGAHVGKILRHWISNNFINAT